ncbi:hypothetical protein CCR83_13945 [Rhodobacter veldkampii DSM 11550]|uniref:UPF0301 protein C5F46_07205 n=1 Tax=Phaeovulum veldkampii DSM 11550 TaxID=1185920 RepID=A0A2T4JIT8_9RHOB|nr:YqgE/AlgH family protein [Phaeovulum veldkampii]MBK5947517.1 hypothetical protein [Phaeovulum veldkampii DSM 11550]NCU21754.1 YqgE/AlgH family protein [Candidatus Falkowbacteria bacterium]PTE17816.1 hypothetical protein C5F46_07205 [Phaeovulum veldkampii DSM 11550]TDQ63365.1 putative transcriptional regulator [Phaeovulum veldkampii DSM 11550]
MDLSGKFLIAMPGMGDPRFAHAVVMLCAYSDTGAMGLIVNKPAPQLRFADLLDQLGLPQRADVPDLPVQFGGPMETGRGFVLHSGEWFGAEGTMWLGPDLAMTSTRDILGDIAAGRGPRRALLALGYAGWGPGQLDAEILENGWLTAEADPELIFAKPNATKWEAALRALGVDPISLSATAGRA